MQGVMVYIYICYSLSRLPIESNERDLNSMLSHIIYYIYNVTNFEDCQGCQPGGRLRQ